MSQCSSDDINKYFEYVKSIGNGAFGVVYKARVLPLARQELPEFADDDVEFVAIKSQRAKNQFELNQYIRETQVMKTIRGTMVLKYYGCFVKSKTVVSVVMELCDGQDLETILKDQLSVGQKTTILGDLARAIGELHSVGIAHRDIKPSNIMICGGEFKLVDYGLAMDLNDPQAKYKRAGTPSYMDLWPLSKERTYLADWWSWGQVAAFMYTGRNYLVNGSPKSKSSPFITISNTPNIFIPVDPASLSLEIPEVIRNLVLDMTNPDTPPEDRPTADYILSIFGGI